MIATVIDVVVGQATTARISIENVVVGAIGSKGIDKIVDKITGGIRGAILVARNIVVADSCIGSRIVGLAPT